MNSLGVLNIYELLDDDSSGGVESGKKVQAAIQQKQKEAIAASKPAVVAKPAQSAATGQPKKQNDRKGDKPVGDKVRSDKPRGDRKPRNPDSPLIEGQDKGDRRRTNKPSGDRERRPRVEGEQPRGNKRQFDRRSGTGRSLKENKKGGAGKGNWGTATDEQAAVAEGGVKVETEEVKKEGEEATTEEGAAAAATEKTQQQQAPEEEEEKVRTLDEYLTEVKSKNLAALPSQRVVNDEEQKSKWKEFVPLQRDDEQLFSVEGNKQKKQEKGAASGKDSNKVSADQVIKFQKENPNKRDKNARGGNNNSNSGAKPQRGGAKQGTPNITDEKSFPALSPKA